MPDDLRQAIAAALRGFTAQPLDAAARALFAALGYRSDRTLAGQSGAPEQFLAEADPDKTLATGSRRAKALVDDWQEARFLFQLTGEEISASGEAYQLRFAPPTVDREEANSYLFLAVRLRARDKAYTRTELADATRELNRLGSQPVLVVFQYGDRLTIAIIARRRNKVHAERDVLEKVTLIKDVSVASPHRGHLEILCDLALPTLCESRWRPTNFAELQRAWERTLDASLLNKRFYVDVANWFYWAKAQVVFPAGAGEDEDTRNSVSLIRLITRLIFCWFLKEKGLLSDALFDEAALRGVLADLDPAGSTYYKAILQNLFFATLNQEMGDQRAWRTDGRHQHNITTVYRYKALFRDPDAGLALFRNVPFLNGGLFDCLDKQNDSGDVVRVDSFSDHPKNAVSVPTELFFGDRRSVNLNTAYGTQGKTYQVRGLIPILKRFKFTIEENTPIEEEVALDPELLGQVFENLLAAYDPATGVTARKESGSFYTPREVVDFMVDEALVAALSDAVPDLPDSADRLRRLLSYEEEVPAFTQGEVDRLVRAIDALNALDPACGSGAFPMGLLNKLVHALRRLDPDNSHWRAAQKEHALQEMGPAYEEADAQARMRRIAEIDAAFELNLEDYGRKLYLIENCIYGVDIQPIAVQIAKLRFFISLVVEQRTDEARPNRGIRPLPNLETRFVAANTLLGVPRPGKAANGSAAAQLGMDLHRDEVDALERDLHDVRARHFSARTPDTKRKYREKDRELRERLAGLLQRVGYVEQSARLLAHWDPYDQNASAPFFEPEWMFGVQGGFDVVIGNPPYVRAEKITALKPALRAQGYTCYSGTADLYVYFYERGLQLLREGGVLVYISSNKYMRAAYGEGLRRHLAAQRIARLVDFGDAPLFTAISYPSIIVVRKGAGDPDGTLDATTWPPKADHAGFAGKVRTGSFPMRRDALQAGGWQLEGDAALRLLKKLQSSGKPLGEVVGGRIYRGILTGLNEAFVVNQATRDALVAEDASSAELLKPMLRGRDVKRWRIDYAGLWLIFARRGVDINRYPAIRRHLEQFRDRLTPGVPGGRKPGSYKWYEVQDPIAYWQAFAEPKIVYPDIAPSPQFAYDGHGGYFGGNTLYFLPGAAAWMPGLLNSRTVFWLFRSMSSAIQGGFVRFFTQYVERIPIPDGAADTRLPALVAQVLEVASQEDVRSLESEIDQEVYRLYDLTDAEIAIIEDSTGSPLQQAEPESQAAEPPEQVR